MSDDFKKFLREFYSQQQYWRIMKFIEHIKEVFKKW